MWVNRLALFSQSSSRAFREGGAGLFGMLLDETMHQLVGIGVKRLEQQRAAGGGRRVDLFMSRSSTYTLPPEKPAPRLRPVDENHDRTAGHVFAAVVAHAFHHEGGAAVTYGETPARAAGHEHLAGSRAEAGDIALRSRSSCGSKVMPSSDGPPCGCRTGPARVVVDFAVDADGFATRNERADGLAKPAPWNVMSMVSSGRPSSP